MKKYVVTFRGAGGRLSLGLDEFSNLGDAAAAAKNSLKESAPGDVAEVRINTGQDRGRIKARFVVAKSGKIEALLF